MAQKNIVYQKRHYFYAFSLVILVSFLIFQNYQIVQIREDYNHQINNLSNTFQDKLDELSGQIQNTSQQIADSNKQYDLQLIALNQKIGDLSVNSESFSNVISNVIDATVTIVTDVGQGSGAIVSSDGYIVTNYHVIQSARRAGAYTYDGEVHSIKLIGYDKYQDIAVLKIISNSSFNYFKFGNSDNLIAGQKVVALGNPAGLSFTATEGIISSPVREIDGQTYIQTDVGINPGNSGGPLINSNGEIIGIINFKVSELESLGFAIPSNRVKNIVDQFV